MVSDTYCSESCWAWWMLGESRWIWFLPPEAYKFDVGLIIKYLCVVVIVVLILQKKKKKKCAKSTYFLSQPLHLMACVSNRYFRGRLTAYGNVGADPPCLHP